MDNGRRPLLPVFLIKWTLRSDWEELHVAMKVIRFSWIPLLKLQTGATSDFMLVLNSIS